MIFTIEELVGTIWGETVNYKFSGGSLSTFLNDTWISKSKTLVIKSIEVWRNHRMVQPRDIWFKPSAKYSIGVFSATKFGT